MKTRTKSRGPQTENDRRFVAFYKAAIKEMGRSRKHQRLRLALNRFRRAYIAGFFGRT